MHEGVAAAEEGSRFSTLHPPPGCSSSWGKLSIPPPLCARLYPPPGKVLPGCLLAPPERGSRVRSRQCRPLGAKALCSELSCRGLWSGSYWNSRFKRCLNDLIKAAEENVQAVRSCSSDEEVLAVLVLLCRGYGWGGPGKISQVFMTLFCWNRKSGSLFFVCCWILLQELSSFLWSDRCIPKSGLRRPASLTRELMCILNANEKYGLQILWGLPMFYFEVHRQMNSLHRPGTLANTFFRVF